MPARAWKFRIEDILEAIEDIRQLTNGMTYNAFCAGQKLKLGSVKIDNHPVTQDKLNKREIHFLHKLRIEKSHYSQEKEQVLRKFGSLSEADMRALTEQGTRLIATVLGLESLPAVVGELL